MNMFKLAAYDYGKTWLHVYLNSKYFFCDSLLKERISIFYPTWRHLHTISYLFGVLFKGIETISDVRDALAKKLHIARIHIFVVNNEEGKILKDNTGIAKLIDRPFEVMIANQNRTLVSGCCKMSCGHFTRKNSIQFFMLWRFWKRTV